MTVEGQGLGVAMGTMDVTITGVGQTCCCGRLEVATALGDGEGCTHFSGFPVGLQNKKIEE